MVGGESTATAIVSCNTVNPVGMVSGTSRSQRWYGEEVGNIPIRGDWPLLDQYSTLRARVMGSTQTATNLGNELLYSSILRQ